MELSLSGEAASCAVQDRNLLVDMVQMQESVLHSMKLE
jgi:hypothetical protein